MTTSMIIIDDFLENAHEMRDTILKFDFPEVVKPKGYPGRNSSQRLNMPGIEQTISSLVCEPVRAKVEAGHGMARITLAGDKGAANIHIDPGYWSGILYLSLQEHCEGGTDFFRHIPTNTDRALLEPEDLKSLGVSTAEEANKIFNNILYDDTHDPAKWEKTTHVSMRFNRLVLLRPWLWHTATPGFGDSLHNGRLIYVMFFNRA